MKNKLRKILTRGAIGLASLLPMKKAEAQNTGVLMRTELVVNNGSFFYQPQFKWQNLDRRAATQLYLSTKGNGSGELDNLDFSLNPQIRKPGFDGAVSVFGRLREGGSDIGAEAGFNVGDSNYFYAGHTRLSDGSMTAGKIGRKFKRQQVAIGASHRDNHVTEDQTLFYAFLRGTLGNSLEANTRLEFDGSDLEKAMVVAQLNATGDGMSPGIRYSGTFTEDNNTHSILAAFGRNRTVSYGSVQGATDFFFVPRAIVNQGHLNYGAGTLSHGYGENVITGSFVNNPGTEE